MTIACVPPDAEPGTAVRLAGYLDCQARALGENGFQALAGGPIVASLLSGLLTIFVALIGYRLVLGGRLTLRDGVAGAVRIGIVLALATAWPGFQTLVYGVAVDGPGQLSAAILPSAGLPSESLEARVQQTYDTIRLGWAAEATDAPNATTQGPPRQQLGAVTSPLAQPPLPQTASALVISTIGVAAALRVAIGFLIAIGPLAIMSLLFDATLGVFSGWVRALSGAALGLLAATIVTAIDLVMIESELARLQEYSRGGTSAIVDGQALTTITLVFALIMLVAVLAAMRVGGAFRLHAIGSRFQSTRENEPAARPAIFASDAQTIVAAGGRATGEQQLSRASAVGNALNTTVRRENASVLGELSFVRGRQSDRLSTSSRDERSGGLVPLGVAGRRSIGRQSLSAARRDRAA